MSILSSNCLLVSLDIKISKFTKADDEGRYDLTSQLGCDEKRYNVQRHILRPKDDHSLGQLHSIKTTAFNLLAKHTMAWGDTNGKTKRGEKRIVLATVWDGTDGQGLAEQLGDLKKSFDDHKRQFLNNYPSLIQRVSVNCGSNTSLNDYPELDDVDHTTWFAEPIITPLPSSDPNDIRLNVSEATAQNIKRSAVIQERKQIKGLAKQIVDHISELGEDISSRMQEANNGKKTFVKDELWNSFSGLVAKLPDMNEKLFGNDETISKLYASCTKVIEKGGDHYRNKKNKDSDIARSQAIDEIKNSTDQFNDDFWKSFNGGNNEK